ncbi:MAG: hypothetical protein IKR17_12045 [Bacteroidales bacterium]|nr:hypothetical protein [Bacteroidales bacterium]
MKTSYLYIFITAALATLSACSNDLEKVIWVSDDTDSDLPAYTEWGYNSFGAYVNNRAFTSNRYSEIPTMCFVTSAEHLTFCMENSNHHDFSPDIVKLSFRFPYKRINSYVGLSDLHGMTIDLASDDVIVSVLPNNDTNSEDTLKIARGTLTFSRVQMLHIDDNLVEAIVSGTFDFDGSSNSASYEVRKGRFDFGADGDDISFY